MEGLSFTSPLHTLPSLHPPNILSIWLHQYSLFGIMTVSATHSFITLCTVMTFCIKCIFEHLKFAFSARGCWDIDFVYFIANL